MDINEMAKRIMKNPDAGRIGMIATHLGVVRDHSRDGRAVDEINVEYNHSLINNIIEDIKRLPGIVEVLIETNEDKLLQVGDEIMAVAVAGDIREHVFPALSETVDRVKKEACRKKEYIRE